MSYPVNLHQNYHAHFYFGPETSDYAAQVREDIHQKLGLFVGRFNQRLVGPHTQWSFEIDFNHAQFDDAIAWLDNIRQQHSVLVHAVTDNDYLDHTEYVYWLGEPIQLDLSLFSAP
ncbi:DOPA 4,5-dioxygenase family protein [Vibrio renipiscarius]|uniref:4,5-dioxygenase n=1 Tax=Vibrio renipiscarius TaxID=1461322 RepID=A0A0C2NIX7_9VIBR|nr:DOPA 4,5-dioxygenase family protein [Vibrio renipiscarius]KII79481.1 4,5-dioxygenase [Vibrio renipiscarius]KII80890.1 4,5-dioxygenase [Vibrio renipiscarius]